MEVENENLTHYQKYKDTIKASLRKYRQRKIKERKEEAEKLIIQNYLESINLKMAN